MRTAVPLDWLAVVLRAGAAFLGAFVAWVVLVAFVVLTAFFATLPAALRGAVEAALRAGAFFAAFLTAFFAVFFATFFTLFAAVLAGVFRAARFEAAFFAVFFTVFFAAFLAGALRPVVLRDAAFFTALRAVPLVLRVAIARLRGRWAHAALAAPYAASDSTRGIHIG